MNYNIEVDMFKNTIEINKVDCKGTVINKQPIKYNNNNHYINKNKGEIIMENIINLAKKQSRKWDMNISFKELVENNKECMVDRNYKAHKHDECFNGYCIYLKHPLNNKYETMIGIAEDGFIYIGDGLPIKELPKENTMDVVEEMISYRDWVMKSEDNKFKLMLKGIDYDDIK